MKGVKMEYVLIIGLVIMIVITFNNAMDLFN